MGKGLLKVVLVASLLVVGMALEACSREKDIKLTSCTGSLLLQAWCSASITNSKPLFPGAISNMFLSVGSKNFTSYVTEMLETNCRERQKIESCFLEKDYCFLYPGWKTYMKNICSKTEDVLSYVASLLRTTLIDVSHRQMLFVETCGRPKLVLETCLSNSKDLCRENDAQIKCLAKVMASLSGDDEDFHYHKLLQLDGRYVFLCHVECKVDNCMACAEPNKCLACAYGSSKDSAGQCIDLSSGRVGADWRFSVWCVMLLSWLTFVN